MSGYYKIVVDDTGDRAAPPGDVYCSREQADSAFRTFLRALDNARDYRKATDARIVGPFESRAEAEQA